MYDLRRYGWYVALAIAGAAASVLQITHSGVPAPFFSLETWFRPHTASLAFTTFMSAIGAVGTLMQVFNPSLARKDIEPLATKGDLKKFEDVILAVLIQKRVVDSPFGDADSIAAQQRTVERLMQSRDPLDGEAKARLRMLKVDASIEALLEAEGTNRGEAASRFRDAGMLALSHDLATATYAFEQAASLDPDHFWTWIFLSRLYVRRGQLENARRPAIEALRNAKLGRERAVALLQIGVWFYEQGSLKTSLTTLRQSLAMFQGLANQDDLRSLSDLATIFEAIGNTYLRLATVKHAKLAFSNSREIRLWLAKMQPGADWPQFDLISCVNRLGDAWMKSKNFPDALAAYAEALGVAERLVRSSRDIANAKHALAACFDRHGDVFLAMMQPQNAAAAYRANFDIVRRLTQTHKQDVELMREFAISHFKLGDIQRQNGDLRSAFRYIYSGFVILQRTGDVRGMRALINAGSSHDRMGRICEATGNLKAAKHHYAQSREIFQRISRSAPYWADVKSWTASAAHNMQRLDAA